MENKNHATQLARAGCEPRDIGPSGLVGYRGPSLLLALGLAVASAGFNEARADDPDADTRLGASESETPAFEHPSEHLRVSEFPGSLIDADLSAWQEYSPDIQDIEIPSSADDTDQPALFYDSGSDEEKPLLLVLHSWSTNYLQNIDIPLGQFAVANDWVFIHPDFRGENDGRPESMASELVISDMEDALEYALENANIDESRIYLLGYSGGAMNALHLASRNPDVFAGVAAWVPVYDLVTWYEWSVERDEDYADEIAGACGGEPREGTEAHAECVERSARAHLPDVAGDLRVLIAHGIEDDTVPPDQGLHAFNDLADEEDRIPQEQIDQLMEDGEVPEELRERSTHDDHEFPHFAEAEAPVLLYLQSGPAELVLFDGEHEMLYRPGLEWLGRQQR
ncbi:alpha/beta hydrolase family protein [Billgrantia endophytica]|uniref:Dipeptidyl aminopeptidase n=1 Tax=Billgrantia endophytica TaxID=2033802 RepID=A0A2N7U339_9GAMM|nr:alpha/beta fold hydrolase [Halomonas endophytica]PMR74854.1 dipeptidyl aminopeptidase [Halomonas endophytica]